MEQAEYSRLIMRQRRMPEMLENTASKLRRLMKEAREIGMGDLVNEAWEIALTEGQADARSKGGSVGFGDEE